MTSPIKLEPDVGLSLTIGEGVATVQLTARRMSLRMLRALEALPQQLMDSDIRAVVVESERDDFCHGIDLTDPEILGSVQTDRGRSIASLGGQMIERWSTLGVPTVAAVSNWTIGAGACLAFACDFRYAAPLTRISFPEVDRGMHLSWGIIPLLIRECGLPLTRRLAMLGDPLAAEEFPVDVFTLSDDPRTAAHGLATRLADKPAAAVRHIKAVISADGPSAETLDEDVRRFVDSLSSPGFAQAMNEWFAGKRSN
jgi:enoyl-CoA hydratase/carnithine racemase